MAIQLHHEIKALIIIEQLVVIWTLLCTSEQQDYHFLDVSSLFCIGVIHTNFTPFREPREVYRASPFIHMAKV
jgi:hypothetical protein